MDGRLAATAHVALALALGCASLGRVTTAPCLAVSDALLATPSRRGGGVEARGGARASGLAAALATLWRLGGGVEARAVGRRRACGSAPGAFALAFAIGNFGADDALAIGALAFAFGSSFGSALAFGSALGSASNFRFPSGLASCVTLALALPLASAFGSAFT